MDTETGVNIYFICSALFTHLNCDVPRNYTVLALYKCHLLLLLLLLVLLSLSSSSSLMLLLLVQYL